MKRQTCPHLHPAQFQIGRGSRVAPAAKKTPTVNFIQQNPKHCVAELFVDVSPVESAIESFIRYLAVERGLSDNYQLSTQRSLNGFASWCARQRKIDNPRAVTLPMISEYLGEKKKAGLSAASIKLIVVALKIFFRFLAGKG